MTEAESLWRQLLSYLDDRGLLPIQNQRSTPAEIAQQLIETTGDHRAYRFVWGFYYPRCYGDERGSLSYSQAKALVLSFEKPPTEDAFAPPVDKATPPVKIVVKPRTQCGVCRTRWLSTEVHSHS